jgi:hypothetical protein
MQSSLEHISTLIVLVALVALSVLQFENRQRLQALEERLAPPVPAVMYRLSPRP